jgi:hypothetical protein
MKTQIPQKKKLNVKVYSQFDTGLSMMGNDRSVGWERKRLNGNCGPVESETAGPTLEFTVRKEILLSKEMLGKKTT